MKKATITEVILDEARELYNSHNKTLKELALKCFSGNELKLPSFSEIKTFEDAINVLNLDIYDIYTTINRLEKISKASAAMFKLNIIKNALNLNYELYLTSGQKKSYIYCPYNPFITKSSTYYNGKINSGEMEIIGKFKNKSEEYYVLYGGSTEYDAGLGFYYPCTGIGHADIDLSIIGCATEEIANHFGKYFGMLITEVKYGDIDNFIITNDIYGNA